MLTLRFTSCYVVVVVEFVVAPVKPPFFMRDSCHRWFFRIFLLLFYFCFVFGILYFGHSGARQPFRAR